MSLPTSTPTAKWDHRASTDDRALARANGIACAGGYRRQFEELPAPGSSW